MQSRSHAHPIRTTFQLLILGALVAIGLNYNLILDQYALATFKPSQEMAAIEGRLGLTQKARATFYRTEPRIDDKVAFNRDCNTGSLELELGCYYRRHIYVLRIENPSLAPEMDVVTAHELLHAVWASMGASERNRLAEQLQGHYEAMNDKELVQRMAGYARSEPGEESNELHSILGTEFGNLPESLERHYAKYFVNRSVVVQAHQQYLNVFKVRRAELESELTQIRAQKGQLAVLNRQMDSLKKTGQVAAYNALVPRQNRLVDEINNRILAYTDAVAEFNALSKSLDSQEITETETLAK